MKLSIDILKLYIGREMYRGGLPNANLTGIIYVGTSSECDYVRLEYGPEDCYIFPKHNIAHKPYLRSLESITDEECLEWNTKFDMFNGAKKGYVNTKLHVIKGAIFETKGSSPEKVLWLINKGFDVFDLIKNKCAFEAKS